MMQGLLTATSFFIHTLFSLYILIVMLRFLFELSRVNISNPVAFWVVKLTEPPLKPLRKIIPTVWNIDLALIVLLFLLEFAHQSSLSFLRFPIFPNIDTLLLWSLGSLINLIFKIYFYVILLAVIFSWLFMLNMLHLSPYNPMYVLLKQLMEPIVRPIRNIVPPIAGMDFAPLITLMLIYGFDLFFQLAIPSPRW